MLAAHDYHFAFIEMEYNGSTQKYEGSLKVSAHDLAYIYSKELKTDLSIETLLGTDTLKNRLERDLLNGFTVRSNKQILYFKMAGHQLTLEGDLLCFFTSEVISSEGPISVEFPLLMNYFVDQQNKFDYLSKGKHHNLSFIKGDDVKSIPNKQ